MDHPVNHLFSNRMEDPISHLVSHPEHQPIGSSFKKEPLHDLVLEGSFQDLNPRSLTPYLNQFDTTQELQEFLDMANACIAASKEGHGKPIQNAHGFLFAQLKLAISIRRKAARAAGLGQRGAIASSKQSWRCS
jgi:hypothetical protein